MKWQQNSFSPEITEWCPLEGLPVGTLKFLRKYHDIKLKVWHSWQNILENVLPFSCKSSSNKVDVRRSSQAPLAMSIAHYLLITGKLKGHEKCIQKDTFMFYWLPTELKPLNSHILGYFVRKNKYNRPLFTCPLPSGALIPAQHKIEHLSHWILMSHLHTWAKVKLSVIAWLIVSKYLKYIPLIESPLLMSNDTGVPKSKLDCPQSHSQWVTELRFLISLLYTF